MIAPVVIIILVSSVLYSIYKWSTITYDFFKKLNVPYVAPVPLLGNLSGVLFRTESLFDALQRFYKESETQVFGLFEMRNPVLAIKDLALIKQITVKDFDYFMNHRTLIEAQDDVLFGNSLFAMKDQKWKDMRSTLSPAFTGSKMRMMLKLICECCEEGVKNLKIKSEKHKSGEVNIEMKEYFTQYTNDVIASTAFGLKINSMMDKDNEFFKMGKKAKDFNSWTMLLKFSLFSNFKSFMRFFKVQLFNQSFTRYFIQLVTNTIKYRETNNIVRPDMINMLMESQKSPEKVHDRQWTDEEIVSQCFFFFIAGFETMSILMSFTAHEILENSDVQEKLILEIDNIKEQLQGQQLNYESLQSMKYLDMIIAETLRKWPAALVIDRVCSKPYVLKSDGLDIHIKPGDTVWIPIVGLHYDPKNFPNPKKFDPERFNDENKKKIQPFSYAPFGFGQRSCIANRLALMEAKAILYYIFCNFTLQASEKTSIPLELQPAGFQLKTKNGFWMKLIPRN